MKKTIMFLFITLSSLCFLTSCGTFFSEEELMISSITSKTLDDGSTKLIINYTDETKTPDEFIIPRGLTGNGIKEIKTSKGEKEGTTIVEVIYTDMYMSPVTFEVKDGKDITGVSTKIDEETDQCVESNLYENMDIVSNATQIKAFRNFYKFKIDLPQMETGIY